jgi:hypothetical protein
MEPFSLLKATERQRVSDGKVAPVLSGCENAAYGLVVVWPQLGDFDSLEYAWWLQREAATLKQKHITVRAVGIGDRNSGQKFCDYTGFPADCLFVDPTAELHQQLNLYAGLSWKVPGLKPGQQAWVNLMLMCAGLGSPGTLAEVFRGYRGDRQAPQLIDNESQGRGHPPACISGIILSLGWWGRLPAPL